MRCGERKSLCVSVCMRTCVKRSEYRRRCVCRSVPGSAVKISFGPVPPLLTLARVVDQELGHLCVCVCVRVLMLVHV